MVVFQAVAIILAALIPAFIWLAFFLKEDEHPEPKQLLIKTFSIGMLASVPSLALQLFIQKMFPEPVTAYATTVFLFAAAEEIFKFLGVRTIVNKSPDFDEPIDAMIYMVMGGLGFATIENILIIGSLLSSSPNGFIDVSQALFLRLVGATLLHTLASALAGYYWARGIVKNKRMFFVHLGLFVAIAVHGAFNYLVYEFQDINIFFPTIFLVGISFFVFSGFEKLKQTVL